MTLSNLSTFLLFSAILAFQSVNSASPTPSVDCSSLVLNMADCLSYVSNGSTVEQPEGSCCSGLKTVVRSNPDCLCEGFKSSASMGVVLNMTKAMALPAACKVSAPSAAKCDLSLTPAGSPTIAPALSPQASSPTGDMAPTGSEGGDSTAPTMSAGENSVAPGMTPALSPGISGSSMLTTSFASLVLVVSVVASFSSL